MPPEVRDRLRERALGGGAARGGAVRRAAPLVAAAAVLALVAGGVVVSRFARDDSPATPPPTPSTVRDDVRGTPAKVGFEQPSARDLAECELPSAEFTAITPASRIVVGDVLCEITLTSVTRTARDGGALRFQRGLRGLLRGEQVYVGSLPAGLSEITSVRLVSLWRKDLGVTVEPVTRDGLFFVPLPGRRNPVGGLSDLGFLDLAVDGGPVNRESIVGQGPASTTRELSPADDGSTTARCLQHALEGDLAVVRDPADWRVVARVAHERDQFRVLRDGSGATVHCPTWDGVPDPAGASGLVRPERGFAVLGVSRNDHSRTVYLAGRVEEGVSRLELTESASGAVGEVSVQDGVFIARFPDLEVQPGGQVFEAGVFDADGRERYRGPAVQEG
ncbi:hypothetical protein GCM10010428_69350 [Actinosynnema pretiosum subsp. pretiosum]